MNFDALDRGIRLTVRWLRDHNFCTTDSGDGVSKAKAIAGGWALAFPHVFMTCEPAQLISEANRLRELLRTRGLSKAGRVEGTYSPDDGVAVIALLDINDDALISATPTGSTPRPVGCDGCLCLDDGECTIHPHLVRPAPKRSTDR